MNPRCEGLPNLPCGRVLSGREGWCLQHGDQEDRDSRWARDGMSKRDIDPLIGATRQVTERLPRPNEDQLAFDLNTGLPEDHIDAPQKKDITRPPHMRKGAKRDERVPIPEDLHGRLWHMLTLEEKLAARQRMTDAQIAAWAKRDAVLVALKSAHERLYEHDLCLCDEGGERCETLKAVDTMTPSEVAKWAAGLAS